MLGFCGRLPERDRDLAAGTRADGLLAPTRRLWLPTAGLKRPTCEASLALDIRYLRRQGLLRPGHTFSCTWSRDGRPTASIEVTVTVDAVLLTFEWRYRGASEWQRGSQCVTLTWTPCHFRGVRPWFLCPGADSKACGRRCAVLYRSNYNPHFACRKCRRLAYAIEQENPRHRRIRRAQRARLRLGGSSSLLDPLPSRPKGMHISTYNRLWGKALIAAERWVGLQPARAHTAYSGPVRSPPRVSIRRGVGCPRFAGASGDCG